MLVLVLVFLSFLPSSWVPLFLYVSPLRFSSRSMGTFSDMSTIYMSCQSGICPGHGTARLRGEVEEKGQRKARVKRT